MRLFLPICATLACLASAVAAPAPVPETKKEVMPIEIDFSNLGGVAAGVPYSLAVTVKAEDKTTHEKEYSIRNLPTKSVRDLVASGFPKEWKVEAVGDNVLVIKGYKDSPVAEVHVTLGEVAAAFTPSVTRQQKKDK